MAQKDFKVANHGGIFLLLPSSEEGKDWCNEHLPGDCPMFGNAYAIEHRYIGDIVLGMMEDGLVGG